MKFVLIFGPQAVGKMSVGQELEKITDLKLFHNHMTIDLLHTFFGFEEEMWRLSDLFRREIFTSVANSDMYGLIFTYVWAFDQQADWDFVQNVCETFESRGGTVCFVELEAELDERLTRNKHPHRLEHKPTKRDIEQSEYNLKTTMQEHRLNSNQDEIKKDHYVRIDNTNLSPNEVAKKIKNAFQL
ncbi:hypothetical protein [Pontibacillus yanchengensis]|uniref:Shikimate kinase n=1 Tax=Pontibacillus yanchengensis Y32 TaxID=1385514 RepID=A0A0A2TC86_9BACI|nr:hypothetical protein [Pontibacillus yanchengensis]KGP73412.1 shikimate kinase [Pontibacillus yanchengensis Y32]